MKRLMLVCACALAVTIPTQAHAAQGKSACQKYPVLNTAKGAHKRANKGWNDRKVKKNGEAIRRVRIQSRCAPTRKGRRHVRRVIDDARAEYRKAKENQTKEFGPIDPPGAAYLANLRACESGGNYSTNTGNGYYGAYQFDLQTWASVGGSGLPSDASPEEQDYRAAELWRQRGSSPWPVCG